MRIAILALVALPWTGASASADGTGEAGENESPSLPEEVDPLRLDHEILLTEVEKPLGILAGHYLRKLEKLQKETQATGDLQAVLAIQKEIEAVREAGQPPDEPVARQPSGLAQARRIYRRAREKIEKRIAPRRAALQRKYAADLAALQQTLTREGRLDDALAVKREAQLVREEIGRVTALDPDPKPDERDREVKLRMQVDGVSHLLVRGDEIWYDHRNGRAAPPGRHQGEFPTYIDDDGEWMPEWEGSVTEPHDIGLGLPAGEPAPELHLRMSPEGRGHAEIVEQPSRENGYTARIELRDESRRGKRYFGSEWMEFRLWW